MNCIEYFKKHCNNFVSKTVEWKRGWTKFLPQYTRFNNYLPLTKTNIKVLNSFIKYMQSINCFVSMQERHTTSPVYSDTNIKQYHMGCWINHTSNNSVCKIIILYHNQLFTIILGNKPEDKMRTGLSAFNAWKKADTGHVLDKLALNIGQGQTYADQCRGLTKVDSVVNSFANGGYALSSCKIRGAFHLDGNSMWPAGACEKYPEMKSIIDKINIKYPHKEAKMINNLALGVCMSDYDSFGPKAHAQLALAGRTYCTKRLLALATAMKKAGYRILGYQTDGLWAVGKNPNDIYQGPEIGDKMGQFKLDYYGGDLYLVPQGWMYEGGFKNSKKNAFDKALRGNYLYSKKKSYNEWTKKDCIRALKTESQYSLTLNEDYLWEYREFPLPEHIYTFKDMTETGDLTL